MTTYSAHYILKDEEVVIYRRMLESWASAADGETIKTIERLVHNTYDANGETASQVEEFIRLEKLIPFWDVMDEELKKIAALHEADRKLPFNERDASLHFQLMLIEGVVDKVRATQMSSTFTA